MSAAHDAHADASAGHHDAHDHFDNEPATELGADEPRTPTWVPYLGLALFFAAGTACLVCGDEDKPAADKAVAAEAAPIAQPTPPPVAVPNGRPMPGAAMQPGQPGGPNLNALKQLTPEKARELQQQMDAIRGLHNKNPGAVDGVRPVPQPGFAPQPGAVPQPVPAAPPHPAH
jgi:hypothetical protein